MTLDEIARVLLRAADIAENDLHALNMNARLGTDGYSREEHAASRLLRWLSDGANEINEEDKKKKVVYKNPNCTIDHPGQSCNVACGY